MADEFSRVVWDAAKNGNVDELVTALASHPHLIDTPNPHDWGKRTPMCVAAANGHVGVIEKLIELGSQAIDTLDNSGFTPMFWAARNGHVSAIEALVRLGSNAIDTPNKYGITPMYWAASRGHDSMIEALVRLGSNAIDTPSNNDGWTPVVIAVINNNVVCVNALRWLGADCSNIPTRMWSEKMRRLVHEPVDEDKALEMRYRVFFSQSLVGRLLFN